MGSEVEAATERDQPRPHAVGKFSESLDVDGDPVVIDRGFDDLETVEASGSGPMVGDVPADLGWGNDDRVARSAGRHEGVQVGDRAGGDPKFDMFDVEDSPHEVVGEQLDLLDGLEAGLVFLSGESERWSSAETGGEQRLGPRVHDVAGRVEVETFPLVDAPVVLDEFVESRGDPVEVARGAQIMGGHESILSSVAGRCPDADPGATLGERRHQSDDRDCERQDDDQTRRGRE